MTATLLSNMLIPDKWAAYSIQKTTEKSLLWASGIVEDVGGNADIAGTINGGKTVNIPFYNDLTGAAQIIDDTTDLTVNAIGTSKDVATIFERGQAFGSSDLAADISGDDPMGAIALRFADYWNRELQHTLIATLKGAMAASNLTSNVSDISGNAGDAGTINANTFIDAGGKLGDAQSILTAVAMHSSTYNYLRKQDLIDFAKDSQGGADIPSYQGKTVIVDDGMPVSSGVYTSYLFGKGAIAYVEGKPKVPVEFDRSSLRAGGMEWIVNRKRWVMHPRGIKWQGTPIAPTPSDVEVGTGSNWSRVYDPKNIRIIQFKHKIG